LGTNSEKQRADSFTENIWGAGSEENYACKWKGRELREKKKHGTCIKKGKKRRRL